MVECGGLENRFTRNPGDEGSNPSSSASMNATGPGEFPDLLKGFDPMRWNPLTVSFSLEGFSPRGRAFARRTRACSPVVACSVKAPRLLVEAGLRNKPM